MPASLRSEPLLAGKYRLEEVIGTGGMGTVYRATHTVLERPVAVKLMNLHGGDPLLAERFLREARVAAAVRHPHVVDIIDFGTSDTGQPFMVMELLDGTSLWERMNRRPTLTVDEAVDVVAQVLLGLDAVHRAGIIHRDLKPANVFLSPHDGGLFGRLLDFGISYSVNPESRMRRGQFGTDERVIVGTPEYMSPEQAEGRPDVDVRGDVYAMGVILYEILTDGRLPYSDENPGGVLFKVMSGGCVPLLELRPDIPEVARVVDAALAHDREQRPASARDFRRMLLGACGRATDLSGPQLRGSRTPVGITVMARSERPTLPAQRRPEPPVELPRHRARWTPLIVAAVVLGGLAAWGLWPSGVPDTTTSAVRSSEPTEPPPPTAVAPPAIEPATASDVADAESDGTAEPPSRPAGTSTASTTTPTSHRRGPRAPASPAAAPAGSGIVRDLDF